jgi:hypothetical protein
LATAGCASFILDSFATLRARFDAVPARAGLRLRPIFGADFDARLTVSFARFFLPLPLRADRTTVLGTALAFRPALVLRPIAALAAVVLDADFALVLRLRIALDAIVALPVMDSGWGVKGMEIARATALGRRCRGLPHLHLR